VGGADVDQRALRLHAFYRGKVEAAPKCAVRGLDDLAIWHTPGVASPCRAIARDREPVHAFVVL
jgi:malate dehydrogenase (oxaloacetate-decarboxylating)